jgi:alpha-L-fucosidase 2
MVRQLLRDGSYAQANALTDQMIGAHDSQCYQMAGDLFLDFEAEGEVSDYRRDLDISTAIAATTFVRGGVVHCRESFVSAVDQVLAMRMSADQAAQVGFALSMDSQMRHRVSATGHDFTLNGQCPFSNKACGASDPVWEQAGVGGIQYVVKVRALPTGGACRASGDRLQVSAADEVVLLLAIETGFHGWDQAPSDDEAAMEAACEARLDAAAQRGWTDLRAAHVEEYGERYNRMALDLESTDERPTDVILETVTDPAESTALVNLVFNFGRYLLISSSRPGTQPANLQGIWNEKLLAPRRSGGELRMEGGAGRRYRSGGDARYRVRAAGEWNAACALAFCW